MLNGNESDENAKRSYREYTSGFCSEITNRFLSLLLNFHRYEPTYIQEFYRIWKKVIAQMIDSKRTESFVSNTEQL